MSDNIWETLDSLAKTVQRQGQRVTELEEKTQALEERLSRYESLAAPPPNIEPLTASSTLTEHHA